jgi:pimeloyl-ACP methyl ester carboxylesterase
VPSGEDDAIERGHRPEARDAKRRIQGDRRLVDPIRFYRKRSKISSVGSLAYATGMDQSTQTLIASDGADLHVQVHGSGAPLLLLHGLTGTGDDWRHVFDLDELATTRRVIRPDARGHGRSTNPTGEFSFRQCARDVVAILDALGIHRADAIGVSLGAKTLLHLARVTPARVDRAILVSATPRFPEPTRGRMRQAACAEHTAEEWALMRAAHVFGDAQIAALWDLPRRLADDALDLGITEREWASLAASRTLIVSGDRDPLYPVELAVELFRSIPRSSLWVVPGGGHGPIFGEFREAFVRTAGTFLRG